MVDFDRAGTDPKVDFPTSDQGILRDIQQEQDQAAEAVAAQVFQVAQAMVDPSAQAADAARVTVAVGNGFQFTPEEVQRQIAQCDSLIKDFERDSSQIRVIARAEPPAPDQASGRQVDAVRKFGADLEKRNRSQSQFLQHWVATLNAAKQRYLRQEHVTEEQWEKLTRGLGG